MPKEFKLLDESLQPTSPEQAIKSFNNGIFTTIKGNALRLTTSMTGKTQWIYLPIEQGKENHLVEVLSDSQNKINVYAFNKNNNDITELNQITGKFSNQTYKLSQNFYPNNDVFLLISIHISLSNSTYILFWNEENLKIKNLITFTWYGIVLGILSILLLHHSAEYVATKVAAYAWYSGMIICSIIWQLQKFDIGYNLALPDKNPLIVENTAAYLLLFFLIKFIVSFIPKPRNKSILFNCQYIGYLLVFICLICLYRLPNKYIFYLRMVEHFTFFFVACFSIIYTLAAKYDLNRQNKNLGYLNYLLFSYILFLFSTISASITIFNLSDTSWILQNKSTLLAIADQYLIFLALAVKRRSERIELSTLRIKFTQDLLSEQERFKQHISSDLHDSIALKLSMIHRALNELTDNLVSPMLPNRADEKTLSNKSKNEYFTYLSFLCEEALFQTRLFIDEIYPHHVEHLGLRNSILHLLKKIESTSNITIKWSIDKLPPNIDERDLRKVYDVFESSILHLINCHCVSQLLVNIVCTKKHYRISIQGIINNAKRPNNIASNTVTADNNVMKNINQRAQLVQGSLHITNKINGNIVYKLSFPLINKQISD